MRGLYQMLPNGPSRSNSTICSTSDSVSPGDFGEDKRNSQLTSSGTWRAGGRQDSPVPTLVATETRPWLSPGSRGSGCFVKRPGSWRGCEEHCFHKAN